MAEDPVGTARFMETVHRPTQVQWDELRLVDSVIFGFCCNILTVLVSLVCSAMGAMIV